MHKGKFSLNKIPGWSFGLIVFGFLYLTGLHTEAIGQVQRALLATGFITPNFPESTSSALTAKSQQKSNEALTENDFILQDLEGNQISFSSLENKVIFLNIWATWCPPCIAEMPSIQKLYEKMKDNPDVAFVILSIDQAGMSKVKPFIRKKGYTFPVYVPIGALPQAFQAQSIPTTLFIGKNGKIEMRHEGMADYDSDEVIDFLKKLTNKN